MILPNEQSNVLVTGGAGYIGSHASLACLAAGWSVTVLDDLSTGSTKNVPAGVELVVGDVSNSDLVKQTIIKNKISAIMHFAGSVVVPESIAHPEIYYNNNTSKTLQLASTASSLGVGAFLFSSTAAVYAPAELDLVSEAAALGPVSPYGHSKLMSEQMLADISDAHGLNVGILRYFNVAGADPLGRAGSRLPTASHLITVACQVALGIRDTLPIFGTDYPTRDGTCVRDYIHVSDLAAAHVLMLERMMSGEGRLTLNCGYGTGATVLEVVDVLQSITGKELPIAFCDRRVGDIGQVVADATRIRVALDWTPKYNDLTTIIGSALEWQKRLVDEQ